MTKEEMNVLMREIDIALMDICDQYDECSECPLKVKYSSIRTGKEYFTGTCIAIALTRVYEINKSGIK